MIAIYILTLHMMPSFAQPRRRKQISSRRQPVETSIASFLGPQAQNVLRRLVLLFVVASVAGQGCPSGSAGQGPCVGNMCPVGTGQTCIGGTACCTPAELIASTTPRTTTNCVDLTNPRTGVSDCTRLSYLCNNAVYFALMTQQCPRTCGRCTGTGTGTGTGTAACRDLTNPRTGVSDCARLSYLCNNAVYFTLMTQQCPATCGRCAGKK